MSRQEDLLSQEAGECRARLVRALVALRAAHDEEGVCSCPDFCVLGEKWARQLLAAKDTADQYRARR